MESLELCELLRMESILGLVAESSGIFSYIFVHSILKVGVIKKKKKKRVGTHLFPYGIT